MKILLTATVYAVLVILISYVFAFPGYGILMLPQPFLDVYVGRWTMFYVINSKVILWIGYVIFIHLVYYRFVKPTIKTIILGGILFFTISIALTLFTDLVDPDLRIRLPNYLVGGYSLIYWTAAVVVNSFVELLAWLPLLPKKLG
uniref:Uncharacterized protein n=2 Tax=Geoglobus ahangari TaxID=113653 RepID=A0A7C3UC07_9EURY